MYIVFFLLWVALNGRLTVEIAVFGAVISAAMYIFICRFDGFSPHADRSFVRRVAVMARYFLHMIGEIFIANLKVIRLVLSPKYEPEPCLVRFRTELVTEAVQVLLADSITITPGTITASLEDGVFTVHCLDSDFADITGNERLLTLLKTLESGSDETESAR